MNIKKYSCEKKFEDSVGYGEDKDYGSQEWIHNHYDIISTLPDVNKYEFPSIEVFELSSVEGKKCHFPQFICIFHTCIYKQIVEIYNVVDLFELINSMMPIISRVEHLHTARRLDRDMKEMKEGWNKKSWE